MIFLFQILFSLFIIYFLRKLYLLNGYFQYLNKKKIKTSFNLFQFMKQMIKNDHDVDNKLNLDISINKTDNNYRGSAQLLTNFNFFIKLTDKELVKQLFQVKYGYQISQQNYKMLSELFTQKVYFLYSNDECNKNLIEFIKRQTFTYKQIQEISTQCLQNEEKNNQNLKNFCKNISERIILSTIFGDNLQKELQKLDLCEKYQKIIKDSYKIRKAYQYNTFNYHLLKFGLNNNVRLYSGEVFTLRNQILKMVLNEINGQQQQQGLIFNFIKIDEFQKYLGYTIFDESFKQMAFSQVIMNLILFSYICIRNISEVLYNFLHDHNNFKLLENDQVKLQDFFVNQRMSFISQCEKIIKVDDLIIKKNCLFQYDINQMEKKDKGAQSMLEFKNELLIQTLSMQVLRNIFSCLKNYQIIRKENNIEFIKK